MARTKQPAREPVNGGDSSGEEHTDLQQLQNNLERFIQQRLDSAVDVLTRRFDARADELYQAFANPLAAIASVSVQLRNASNDQTAGTQSFTVNVRRPQAPAATGPAQPPATAPATAPASVPAPASVRATAKTAGKAAAAAPANIQPQQPVDPGHEDINAFLPSSPRSHPVEGPPGGGTAIKDKQKKAAKHIGGGGQGPLTGRNEGGETEDGDESGEEDEDDADKEGDVKLSDDKSGASRSSSVVRSDVASANDEHDNESIFDQDEDDTNEGHLKRKGGSLGSKKPISQRRVKQGGHPAVSDSDNDDIVTKRQRNPHGPGRGKPAFDPNPNAVPDDEDDLPPTGDGFGYETKNEINTKNINADDPEKIMKIARKLSKEMSRDPSAVPSQTVAAASRLRRATTTHSRSPQPPSTRRQTSASILPGVNGGDSTKASKKRKLDASTAEVGGHTDSAQDDDREPAKKRRAGPSGRAEGTSKTQRSKKSPALDDVPEDVEDTDVVESREEEPRIANKRRVDERKGSKTKRTPSAVPKSDDEEDSAPPQKVSKKNGKDAASSKKGAGKKFGAQ